MNQAHPWHGISVGDKAPAIINAVVEITKDSKLKFELDKETGMMKLDRFLYSAVHYPGDYGFIPQTYWEDGDPLDIIILTGRPVYPGMLVEARVVGVIHMLDDNESDDKIIAVYDCDPRFKEFDDLEKIPKHMIDELTHFFETYKLLQKKEVKILEVHNKKMAHFVIKEAQRNYEQKFGAPSTQKEASAHKKTTTSSQKK
ncbi:MAG: inorganic diphosphatase [Candidatus Woesearchaeota archaeon]